MIDDTSPPPDVLPPRFAQWFAGRGWTPRRHQLDLLALARQGQSVLLDAPTGAGKTLAGFLPSLVDLAEGQPPKGLHTLYISPLKALAVDVARNLDMPAAEMELGLRIETRTGDTPAHKRTRQMERPPHILLTTPEQLALLLAHREAEEFFSGLKRVVLDELHALVTSKRGDLLALGLARLHRLAPGLGRVLGLAPDLVARTVRLALGARARARARALERGGSRLGRAHDHGRDAVHGVRAHEHDAGRGGHHRRRAERVHRGLGHAASRGVGLGDRGARDDSGVGAGSAVPRKLPRGSGLAARGEVGKEAAIARLAARS